MVVVVVVLLVLLLVLVVLLLHRAGDALHVSWNLFLPGSRVRSSHRAAPPSGVREEAAVSVNHGAAGGGRCTQYLRHRLDLDQRQSTITTYG